MKSTFRRDIDRNAARWAVGWHRLARMLCAGVWLALVAGRIQAVAAITNFAQFYGLSLEQSREGLPFRFNGVVLCYDSGWRQLYVHDGSETHWINPLEISARPVSGQQVEVTAVTTVISGKNGLTNLALAVLKPATLPKAKPLALSQLGSDSGQWVEIQGSVRMVDFSWERTLLSLSENGQSCKVFILGPPQTNDLKRLLGSQVRIRGINDSKVAKGRLVSASLMAPNREQVIVTQPATANQPVPPIVSVEGLMNLELGDWTNRPVRVTGLVVSHQLSRSLVVKDPTGAIRAEISQNTMTSLDERVDVTGFLKVTPTETVLSDARFEVIKAVPLPVAPVKAAAGSGKNSGSAKVLTQISQILKMRKDESAQLPVRLRGVVLYADSGWRNGFLHDQHAAIYFDLTQSDVRSGQWVELTGEIDPGGFAPQISNTSVKILGTTNLPAPARVDLTDLADGHLDAQWIQLEGVVQSVIHAWSHVTLRLMTPKGKFTAIIPGYDGPTPTHLVDALVSIQGACSTQMNVRRQVTGITLQVPGMAHVKILEPAPDDPFAVAATPIVAVATFDPDRLTGRRIKVSGVITLNTSNQEFFMQDDSGGLRVHTQQTNDLRAGDQVDVLGFLALGDFSPELEEASLRRTGRASVPTAQPTTAEEILLKGVYDGEEVTLEARLLQSVARSANPQLVLQDGSVIFTARLGSVAPGERIAPLPSGSVVRLRGVCSIQGGGQAGAKAFRLLLRSPADVVLISSPPWWTARHSLWTFGSLGAVLLISLAWVIALRQQVHRQTSTLREQIAERERMQVQIEKTHKELLHASRQAGMAEIATNVLHNVGNVLNSVNVSASVVTDRLQASKADGVARVAELLEQHRHDLPGYFAAPGRTDQVINFLRTLAQHLASEQKVSLKELAGLTKHIGHIKEIVAMQQNYARVSGVTESVNLLELVEDALRMNDGALARHEVQLARDFPAQLPPLTVDKHKVLQVLVNLIRNAKYACDDSHELDRRLTVRVIPGDDRVRIAIVDNGVGIPAENLTRIFSHGFTTRKNGHGFGLHSGALAARELGGSLTAHSEGPGRGATFTLELPTHPKGEASGAERSLVSTPDFQLGAAGSKP